MKKCAKDLGWEINKKKDDWIVFWTDTSVAPERVMKLKSYQRINHFPGMTAIARKLPMARNLNKMQKMFPQYYNFYPKTWLLPFE